MYFTINAYKMYMWWFDTVNTNPWVDIPEDHY